jgi:hypothetical protein
MAQLWFRDVIVVATILHVLVGVAWAGAWGQYNVKKDSLTVIAPEELAKSYDSAIPTFGIPEYRGEVMGTIVYPEVYTRGCSRYQDGEELKKKTKKRPIILLVDRGDCYYSEKVYHAQRAGAAAVLVADDRTEELITMDYPEDGSEDGTKYYCENIKIPSALVQKDFGDKVKEALRGDKEVIGRLKWRGSLPHPHEHAQYDSEPIATSTTVEPSVLQVSSYLLNSLLNWLRTLI